MMIIVYMTGHWSISGNEARQFEIKDTLANQFTAPTVTLPVYRTTTDRDGNTVSYVGKHLFWP